jgi:hypothetical protein
MVLLAGLPARGTAVDSGGFQDARCRSRLALAPAWPAIRRSSYPAVNARLVGPLSASGTCERGQHGECDKKTVQQGGRHLYPRALAGSPPLVRANDGAQASRQ